MIISPVEERKIRPCNDCVAYHDGCACHREEYGRRELFAKAELLSRYWMAPRAVPCIYHITPEEYIEIFGSGIV